MTARKRWGDEAPPNGVPLIIHDPAWPKVRFFHTAEQWAWFVQWSTGSDRAITTPTADLWWEVDNEHRHGWVWVVETKTWKQTR